MENILGWLQFNESLDNNGNSKINEGAIHKFADNVYRKVMDYLETNVIPEGDWENPYFDDKFYNLVLKKAFDCYDNGTTDEDTCTQIVIDKYSNLYQVLPHSDKKSEGDDDDDEPEE
jgi:hypothetical protein